MVNKPKYQHSYSKLDLAGKCPGAFKKKHIDKEPERPSILRDRGRLVHEVNRDYIRALVSTMREQDVELMRSTVRAVFEGQDYLPAEYLSEVMEICETTAATFELDWMHVAGAEKFFSMKLGPYLYRGLIDLLIKDGSFARIIDWKTPHKITPQAEVDRSLQLRSYALATIRNNPEIESVRCELFHCRQGVTVYTDYDREELEAVEDDILALIRKLEAREEFPFTPSSYCGLCDYPETCPAMKEALEAGEVIITTNEDAVRAAEELTLLDRRRKDRTDALKEWCSPHGKVRTGDLVYGHHTTKYRSRDPKKTARLLTEAKMDPFLAGLKFDNKALDKAVFQNGSAALVQAIELVTQEKGFSKFGSRRFQEEDA